VQRDAHITQTHIHTSCITLSSSAFRI